MNLNLDNPNVEELDIDSSIIRHYLESGDPIENLETALDNAQGKVFDGEFSVAYLVIKVVR